jgi:hypothetical protein
MIAGASNIGYGNRLWAGDDGPTAWAPGNGSHHLGHLLAGVHLVTSDQSDAVIGGEPRQAWDLRTGTGAARLFVDVDSAICAVYGKAMSGATYGHTTSSVTPHTRPACRHDWGPPRSYEERLGRHRPGVPSVLSKNSWPGPAAECNGRDGHASGSGFWSRATIAALGRLDGRYTMDPVRCNTGTISSTDERGQSCSGAGPSRI